MNFGNMGVMEILLILVVVLLLFGAKRLPEIGSSMGKGIREFKKSISDVDRHINEPDRAETLYERERLRADRLPATGTSDVRDDDRPEPKRLMN